MDVFISLFKFLSKVLLFSLCNNNHVIQKRESGPQVCGFASTIVGSRVTLVGPCSVLG